MMIYMSDEEMSGFEREAELALYREYRDVAGQFRYAVETDKRFYLANDVQVQQLSQSQQPGFEVLLKDVWVWDVYRPDRFVKSARILTFKDINIEELNRREVSLPDNFSLDS